MNKWTTYNKVFTIKNAYCDEAIKSAVDGINAEIKAERGVYVSTGAASYLSKITSVEFSGEGSKIMTLHSNDEIVIGIFQEDFEELKFDFLIEEELNTGKKVYHSCLITGIRKS